MSDTVNNLTSPTTKVNTIEQQQQLSAAKTNKVKHLHDQIESIKSTICMTNGDRPELWIQRQNLQDLYHQIILSDIDFTIDKKLEQDLWNLVFKSQINYFQGLIRETRPQIPTSVVSGAGSVNLSTSLKPLTPSASLLTSQKRIEAQASLFFFLEAARGFYTKLLEDIVLIYDFNELVKSPTDNAKLTGSNFLLPFCQRFPSIFDKINSSNYSLDADHHRSTSSHKEKQILYICQHILTHLGDIARYASLFQQAKNYYLHAIKLVPYLGHPYNQLGILFETSRTNQLSTIFYYMRSVACRYNFPLASTNMENFFKKLVDTPLTRYNPSLNNAQSINNLLNNNEPHLNLVVKLSHKDLVTLYLQINAMIYYMSKSIDSLATSPPGAGGNSLRIKPYMELFKSSFAAFLTTPLQRDKLDSTQLSQMIAILIFLIAQSSDTSLINQSKVPNSKDDLKSTSHSYAISLFVYLVENLICLFNDATSQPDLVLPALYIAFNFIQHYQDSTLISNNTLWTLDKKNNRQQIYRSVSATVKMLNSCANTTAPDEKNLVDYEDYPLSEDRMLDSFLPFKEIHSKLNFGRYMRSRTQVLDGVSEDWVRRRRIAECVKKVLAKSERCFVVLDGEGVFKIEESVSEKKEEETRREEALTVVTEKSLSIKEESDSSEQQHSSKPQPLQQQRKRRQIVAIHSLEASHANKALLPEPPIISQPILPQQLQQHQHQQFPHQMLNNQMNPMQQQNSNVFMNPMVAGIGIPLNNPAVFNPPLLNDPPPMFQNHPPLLRAPQYTQQQQQQQQQPSFFPSASQRQFQQPANEMLNRSSGVFSQQLNVPNYPKPNEGYSNFMPAMGNTNYNYSNNQQQNAQLNNLLANNNINKNSFNFPHKNLQHPLQSGGAHFFQTTQTYQQQHTHANFPSQQEANQLNFPNFQRDSSRLVTPQQFQSLAASSTNNTNTTISNPSSSGKADLIDHLATSKSFSNIWTNNENAKTNQRTTTHSNSLPVERLVHSSSGTGGFINSQDMNKLQIGSNNDGILTNILQQLNTNLFPNQSSSSGGSGGVDLATISLPNTGNETSSVAGVGGVDWSFSQSSHQKEKH